MASSTHPPPPLPPTHPRFVDISLVAPKQSLESSWISGRSSNTEIRKPLMSPPELKSSFTFSKLEAIFNQRWSWWLCWTESSLQRPRVGRWIGMILKRLVWRGLRIADASNPVSCFDSCVGPGPVERPARQAYSTQRLAAIVVCVYSRTEQILAERKNTFVIVTRQ